jgi:glutamate/tyrosine decarboxylase-like PLP-dependent enzyme
MSPDSELLRTASELAISYAAAVDTRAVHATPSALAGLAAFDEPFPEHGLDAAATLQFLNDHGSAATVATTGPNYYGFVNGATYPVALGASFLTNSWDQNSALPVMSPVASAVYDVTRRWLLDALKHSDETEIAFVTGATVANATGLAAARDALLADVGWDSQANGLFGAPEITVIIGERAHSTLGKSLGLIGLGRERVTIIPSDDQGRIRADLLPNIDGPILVCAQAGEVNTGAFDPFDQIADWAAERNAWMHVDGAFGLWALADPTREHLVRGLDRADSLATDGHKWLNVTYDCGIAFVRRPGALTRTFATSAGYLPPDTGFEAMHHTPQSSQRARQIEVWAVLRTLGRSGLTEVVQRTSAVAVVIAERLRASGFAILNEVVLNQILLRLDDSATTEALIAEIQHDGRIWCGPTQWDGNTAMRISVSSWKTTIDHGEHAADVIIECAARLNQ